MMTGERAQSLEGLPGCLIIGAMRSGTTAFYRLLCQHPDIRPSRIKEPCFFVKDDTGKGAWDRGKAWYKSLFPMEDGLRVEASTLYSRYPHHPGVVDRIYQTVPDAKFIYLVRHPVDRAVSHYLHNVLKGLETRHICKALAPRANSSYVTTGLYYMQLSMYLTRFSTDQFIIVTSESLWKQPQDTMDQITKFLGVCDCKLSRPKKEVVNSIAQLVDKFRRGVREAVNDEQRELLRLLENIPDVTMQNSSQVAYKLGFAKAERSSLTRCFRDDINHLERFIGRPLSEWVRD